MMNEALYRHLKSRFGEVEISNAGERAHTRKVYDGLRKEWKEEIVSAGEYYRVCCPYCHDKRFRLYVNYKWNTVVEGRVYGRGLIHCFNESCSMRHFEDELHAYIGKRPSVGQHDDDARAAVVSFSPVDWPGECVPLNALPTNHAARGYVESRGFDPNELAALWDVRYCTRTTEDQDGLIPGTRTIARMVRGRLIVPVYRSGDLVGWQARALGPAEPKYYTMPGLKKSHLLFNGDRARKYRFGVVVEGVFDAFRVGDRAVALLGKTLSEHQKKLALSYWSMGALCILLDADAVEDMENISKMLGKDSFRWGSFCVTLPGDNDPADMKREELWELIVSYARNRNIQLAPC
jgi:hypothetical protein